MTAMGMTGISGSTYSLVVYFLDEVKLLGRCRGRHRVGSGGSTP